VIYLLKRQLLNPFYVTEKKDLNVRFQKSSDRLFCTDSWCITGLEE